MQADLLDRSGPLLPCEAFLTAFDEAMRSTVHALATAGLDDESIWTAFSEALDLFHRSTLAVERETLFNDSARGVNARNLRPSAA
jgi:hypothetical protein